MWKNDEWTNYAPSLNEQSTIVILFRLKKVEPHSINWIDFIDFTFSTDHNVKLDIERYYAVLRIISVKLHPIAILDLKFITFVNKNILKYEESLGFRTTPSEFIAATLSIDIVDL